MVVEAKRSRSRDKDDKASTKRSKWEEALAQSETPIANAAHAVAMQGMVHQGIYSPMVLQNGMIGMMPQVPGMMGGMGMASATACITYSSKPDLTTDELIVRTLEVENLPATVTGQELMEYFNGAVLAVTGNTIQQATARLAPTFDAKIDSDERTASLYFRTEVGASVGFKLNGIEYKAHKLRVARPTTYRLPEGIEDPAIKLDIKGISVADLIGPAPSEVVIEDRGQPKLSIFGLPPELSELMVKELLEQFGPLRMLNLIKDMQTGLIKGYGFLEYEDEEDADRAVEGLCGFVCGMNLVRITRLGQTQKVNSDERSANYFQNFGILVSMTAKIAENHVLAMQIQKGREIGRQHSRVVQMLNSVYQEDLIDQGDYNEIREEIRLHAARFGAVTEVNIPKPTKDGYEVEGLGKVFVVFQDVTSARKFQSDVNGRKFENRVVCASFYPYDRYMAKQYTLTH